MRSSGVFFIFVVSGAIATAHAQCKLTNSEVEQETRIFGTGSSTGYALLRSDTVSVGTELQMLCPGSAELAVSTTCGATGIFSPALPIGNCAAAKATVVSTTDRDCPEQAYSVSYQVDGQQLELYRSCYSKSGVRALYTTHSAFAYTLRTSRPEMDFTTDGIISGADAATFNRDNVFERFKALLGDKQTYIKDDRTTVIARGHLAPSADFMFMGNMRGTFKYINVVPQFQSINGGNWKRIENWVRRLVETVPSVKVTTGVRDVLQLADQNNNLVDMYLAANNKNPIPKWMYKIVDDGTSKYVFLTYNNIWNAPEQFGGTCQSVGCPAGISFGNTPQSGVTVCCDPTTFKP